MLHIKEGEQTDYLLLDGFLIKGNQLCIPDCSLRAKIIQELHCEGHVSRDRILHLFQSSYYWPTIRKEIERFVQRCCMC